jgi:hypothetical protein
MSTSTKPTWFRFWKGTEAAFPSTDYVDVSGRSHRTVSIPPKGQSSSPETILAELQEELDR